MRRFRPAGSRDNVSYKPQLASSITNQGAVIGSAASEGGGAVAIVVMLISRSVDYSRSGSGCADRGGGLRVMSGKTIATRSITAITGRAWVIDPVLSFTKARKIGPATPPTPHANRIQP